MLSELVIFDLMNSIFNFKSTCFFLVFEGVNLITFVYNDLLIISSLFNDRTQAGHRKLIYYKLFKIKKKKEKVKIKNLKIHKLAL